MKEADVLPALLDRLAAGGDPAMFSAQELAEWPHHALNQVKTAGLLTQTAPAASVTCPGCEEECAMPVEMATLASGTLRPFVVCDKRDDTGRVPVPLAMLEQWQCSADAVCGFVAASLELRRSDKRRPASADFLEISVATGNKRSQMLCLQTDGELMLMAGGNKVPLADCVHYSDGAFSVDAGMINLLVDAATTADNRYTPSNAKREARKVDTQAMYKGWQKAYRELVKKRPNMPETWYANQIAKLPVAKGRNAGTIKKNMHA